jgi:hypothetical protein
MFLRNNSSIKYNPKYIQPQKIDGSVGRLDKYTCIIIVMVYVVLFVSVQPHAFQTIRLHDQYEIVVPAENVTDGRIVLTTERIKGDIDPQNISLKNENKYDGFFRYYMIPGTILLIVIISMTLVIIFYPKRKAKPKQ